MEDEQAVKTRQYDNLVTTLVPDWNKDTVERGVDAVNTLVSLVRPKDWAQMYRHQRCYQE